MERLIDFSIEVADALDDDHAKAYSASRASRSMRSTTTLGFDLGRTNWKPILKEPWPVIRSSFLKRRVRRRCAASMTPSTDCKQRRNNGARGGSRSHMRKNPRRILSSFLMFVSD